MLWIFRLCRVPGAVQQCRMMNHGAALFSKILSSAGKRLLKKWQNNYFIISWYPICWVFILAVWIRTGLRAPACWRMDTGISVLTCLLLAAVANKSWQKIMARRSTLRKRLQQAAVSSCLCSICDLSVIWSQLLFLGGTTAGRYLKDEPGGLVWGQLCPSAEPTRPSRLSEPGWRTHVNALSRVSTQRACFFSQWPEIRPRIWVNQIRGAFSPWLQQADTSCRCWKQSRCHEASCQAVLGATSGARLPLTAPQLKCELAGKRKGSYKWDQSGCSGKQILLVAPILIKSPC